MFPARDAGYAVHRLALSNGCNLRAIERAATRDASDVVCFVHGWACSVYTWRHNMPAVSDAGRRSVAFDLLGHGLSDKPLRDALYTLPAMAAQLREVLDAMGIARPVLVGHSMGAAIALRLALDAPERVAGLVLAAPVGFGAISDMHLLHRLTPPPVERVIPYLTPRWAFRVALWRAYGRIRRATARDVDEYYAPTADPAFLRVLCRLSHAFDWSSGDPSALAGVRCPTAVLFGGRDHLVRASACGRYTAALPDARVDEIPDAGHALPEEVPEIVNAAILRLARIAR